MLLAARHVFPFAPYDLLGWLAIAAPFLLWTTVANGVYLGMGRIVPLNLNSVSAPTLLIVLCLAWTAWAPPLSLKAVLGTWCGTQIVAAILAACFLLRSVGLAQPALCRLRADIRFMAHIGITNAISVLNYRADLFLVQFFLGLSATGIYSIAISVAEMLWLLSSSLTIAAYQRIGADSSDDAAALTLRLVHLNLVLLLLAAPVLAGTAWWILPWLIGAEYRPSQGVLWVLLPGVAMYGCASSLSAYYTNHLGRPGISTGIAALSTVLNVICSASLIPLYGIYGGALGSSIAYIVTLAISLGLFAHYSDIPLRRIVRLDSAQLAHDIGRVWGLLLRRVG
jgi:O-antigen/teichoic acid export membrane protein